MSRIHKTWLQESTKNQDPDLNPDPKSVVRSRGSGSVPTCHGSTTPVEPVSAVHRNAVNDDDIWYPVVYEKSGSGSDSESVSQWYGAADPDPCQKCHGSTTLVVPYLSVSTTGTSSTIITESTKNQDPDPMSVVRSRGSGYVLKCHGSTRLVSPVSADHRNAVHDDDRVYAVWLLRLHLHDVRHQLLNTT